MSGAPPDRPKTANERALDAIRANRPALLAKRPTTDELARAAARQVVAAKYAAPPPIATVTAKLPLAAKLATGTVSARHAANSKIWEVDLRAGYCGRTVEFGSWLGRARRVIDEKRVKGDVLIPILRRVADEITRRAREGKGCGQVSHETLAKDVGCCIETIRKAIRWFEHHLLIVTQNTMGRVEELGNRIVRLANAYYPRMPDEVAKTEPAADVPAVALAPLQRMQADIVWLSQFFRGLVVRTMGLNTTGLRLARPDPA
jgi:hypothetical protein